LIFKEGDTCDHIAIVKQGTFELLKKIPHIIKDEYDLNQMIGSLKIKRDPEHIHSHDKKFESKKVTQPPLKISGDASLNCITLSVLG
jgi:hypothetical protein